MITTEHIINKYQSLAKQQISSLTKDEQNYLMTLYNDSDSVQESLYRLINNISIRPVCAICGKPVKFVKMSKGFAATCSKECKYKLSQQKRGQYYFTNFGVRCPFKIKECVDKRTATWNKKYGGNPNFDKAVRKKIETTNLSRYGVKAPIQNKDIYGKLQQTCLTKYNSTNVYSSDYGKDKCKQTWISKYGVDNPLKNAEISKKAKGTLISKYGVDNVFKLQEYQHKAYQTKKKNKTSISKIEQQFEQYLISHHINYVPQYKSDKYPFNCDFYLSDLDVYIEIQGHAVHGKHPFNSSDLNDIQQLQLLQEKSKHNNFYKAIIYIWTVRDPLKRQIAKQNNIQLLEIFTNNYNDAIQIFTKYMDESQ